ncbi:hypothetical protein [Streptomyces johnsoniae]|uniref:Uncharacterized protein n=1 Tax=Streptomyces johnsoniae TaxID=3075532 RepID=A0ABU2S0V3_9ACTN|nr:hypothetical protein [Streptomyces sp. DSM 41886]MDT0442321.1 hypothetical protein [Streptomyces sp. DSM 41886]
MWSYTPPTVEEGPVTWTDRLFYRVKLTRGVTVLEGPPGVFREVRFPDQDEIRDAYRWWMGGHTYEVDDDTKAALIAAGVATEDQFATPADAYGGGGYGSGVYGD